MTPDEIKALVEKCRSAKANGDPEKYLAGLSVAEAHRIATALADLNAKAAANADHARLANMNQDSLAKALKAATSRAAELSALNEKLTRALKLARAYITQPTMRGVIDAALSSTTGEPNG